MSAHEDQAATMGHAEAMKTLRDNPRYHELKIHLGIALGTVDRESQYCEPLGQPLWDAQGVPCADPFRQLHESRVGSFYYALGILRGAALALGVEPQQLVYKLRQEK